MRGGMSFEKFSNVFTNKIACNTFSQSENSSRIEAKSVRVMGSCALLQPRHYFTDRVVYIRLAGDLFTLFRVMIVSVKRVPPIYGAV